MDEKNSLSPTYNAINSFLTNHSEYLAKNGFNVGKMAGLAVGVGVGVVGIAVSSPAILAAAGVISVVGVGVGADLGSGVQKFAEDVVGSDMELKTLGFKKLSVSTAVTPTNFSNKNKLDSANISNSQDHVCKPLDIYVPPVGNTALLPQSLKDNVKKLKNGTEVVSSACLESPPNKIKQGLMK